MVIRFLQGMFECIISPAFLIVTGLWYKKSEQAGRALLWGTGNSGFTILTSLAMYGIGKAAQKNPDGLAPWKGQAYWLGGLTFLIAAFVGHLSSPVYAKFGLTCSLPVLDVCLLWLTKGGLVAQRRRQAHTSRSSPCKQHGQ